MKTGANYLSYLVRLWSGELQAGGEGESPAWQGEITHIQSGSRVSFQDTEQLFRHLQELIDGDNQLKR